MTVAVRLLTLVDIDPGSDRGPCGRSMSVRARHLAVLADERQVVLLNDRGWSATRFTVAVDRKSTPEERERWNREGPGIWASETVERMTETAKAVVGPDEPYGDRTWEDMQDGHWAWMAEKLGEHGVHVEGRELMALPHDVELSDRILALIDRGARDSSPSD